MNNLSEKKYWSKLWEHTDYETKYVYNINDASHATEYIQHNLLKKMFKEVFNENQKVKFLEIGCGASKYLPYIGEQFGFELYGLDYSEEGCEAVKKLIERSGLNAKIILGDLFELYKELGAEFDVVYTGGVIEHFANTDEVVYFINKYLKDKGIIITTVPNTYHKSLNMIVQKFVGKEIYDIHKELAIEEIKKAHENAGIKTLYCEYITFINTGGINFISERVNKNPVLFKLIQKIVVKCGNIVYYIAEVLHLKPNKITSPKILYIGQK